MKLFRHSIIKAGIILLGSIATLTSCTKTFSDDTPLPNVVSNAIYIGNENNYVLALDPETGEKKWEFNAGAAIVGNVVIHDQAAIVTAANGMLYKIDRASGKVITERNFGKPIIVTPLTHRNKLYVAAGNDLHIINNTDLSTQHIGTVSGVITGAPTPSGIMGKEYEYIFVSHDNSVTSLRADSLFTYSTFTAPNTGAFLMSPCIESDTVMIIGNTNGEVYNVNTRDNSIRWTFTTNGANRSTILTVGGFVLFGSDDRNFRALDLATGRLIWNKEVGDKITSAPYVYNQKVYFGGFDKRIYCVDIIDGTTKWEMPTLGLIKGSPIVHQNKVFIGGYDQMMYCINAEDGSQYWSKNIGGLVIGAPILDNINEVIVPAIDGTHPMK
jgi:outer membrane protein assembly factor BamB